MSRWVAAKRTGIAGFATLLFANLTHEIITFGIGHGFLTGKQETLFYLYPSGLAEIIVINAISAIPSALIIALAGAAILDHALRSWVLGNLWVALCIWSFFTTAGGYSMHFGMTWYWYEPFWELMWSLWLTPMTLLLGLALFLWAVRRPDRASTKAGLYAARE